MDEPILVIACGALARELVALRKLDGWPHMAIQCLPAELHRRPERIPALLRTAIEKYRGLHAHIFVAYADCGTGGGIDEVLRDYGIERLPGAHCYEFLAGSAIFAELADAEPGTFYLTDFLVRHFDRLVKGGLGLDRHPQLLPSYFGNYTRVVFLDQGNDPALDLMARGHANFLGLAYHHHHTGFGPINRVLSERIIQWQN